MSMKPNIWMGYITQASIAKNHLQVNVRQRKARASTILNRKCQISLGEKP